MNSRISSKKARTILPEIHVLEKIDLLYATMIIINKYKIANRNYKFLIRVKIVNVIVKQYNCYGSLQLNKV
jgi:hypothetical protein